MPLIMFPLVLASLSDATVALLRISKFLTAEELAEPYVIDYELKTAVDVDGDFTWETAGKPVDNGQKLEKGTDRKGDPRAKKLDEKPAREKRERKRGSKNGKEPVLPTTAKSDDATEKEEENKADEKPFELKNLKLQVPKGAFVAIVGRVGSGKVMQFGLIICEAISIFPRSSEFTSAGFDW